MQRERAASAVVALAAAILSGCAGTFGIASSRDAQAPPPPDPAVSAATLLASDLEVLQRLVQGSPAEQAQILAKAKHGYETAPTVPSEELQYALVLAAPGHPGFDPAYAGQLLRNVLAAPKLMPSERALAVVVLEGVEQQLGLAAENQRLQTKYERSDSELMMAASRKLQAETDENARLRKELERTRAKLNAIANIERSLSRRKNSTEGPTQ